MRCQRSLAWISTAALTVLWGCSSITGSSTNLASVKGTVKVKGKQVNVENFVGERSARVTDIIGDCKVSVDGDDIIIKGVSLEDVGQTSANLEQATKVKRKDQRIFLDGVYVYEKKKGW